MLTFNIDPIMVPEHMARLQAVLTLINQRHRDFEGDDEVIKRASALVCDLMPTCNQ